MRSLLIIPAFNEEANIKPLLEKIRLCALNDLDVLVVDDHSEDGTSHSLAAFCAADPRIKFLLNGFGEHGLAFCYRTGFHYALEKKYEVVVGMDADLSHDPRDIPRLWAHLKDADWVVGSRYCAGGDPGGMSWPRRYFSALSNFYIRKKLGVDIRDMTSGFNCFRADILKRIDFSAFGPKGFIFQVMMKYRALSAGFTLKEVPIRFHHRYAGRSKFSPHIVWEALRCLNALKG
jgi:dolichol-phosphate mannosyltransferase